MKRGTPDHPKTRQLAVILGLKRFEVVGILESLWHFAASYAKRGDIGRWSNQAIAAALEWGSDADALVAALTTAGFLDADPTHRLLVHDWPDHADQTVNRSEEIKKLGFASRTPADASNTPADASAPPTNASQPKPEPLPKPNPMPEPRPMPKPGDGALPPVTPVPATATQNGSGLKPPVHSASGNSDTTRLPGPANFGLAIGVKLSLPDIGNTPQGKADLQTFKSLYERHIVPGHLGPPGKAVKLCYSEALRIGQEDQRTNKAGTFIGCIKRHLLAAGYEWDE